jgi:zinc transport system substrate-binding protein
MKKILISSLLLSLLLVMASCSKPEKKQASPTVLVSIPPYAYFVEKIAGDTLSIQTLVPAGANPHHYEPSPKQIQQARASALWVAVGEPAEQKMALVMKEQNPQIAILDLSTQLPLLEHEHQGCSHHHEESRDLHFWLSPKLAKKQAELIAERLIAVFPENASIYKVRLAQFVEELTQLDREIAFLLKPQKGQAILASHAAFGYFCQDYGLIQLAIESEGKDPLPKEAERTLSQAEKLHIKSVLLQAQYNNKGAELIAEKLHLPTYLIDPYSADYMENMRYLAEIIAQP